MEQRIEKVHQLLVKAEIELSEIRNIFLMQCQHTLKPIHQGVGSESFSNDPTGYVCTKCDTYFEASVEEKDDIVEVNGNKYIFNQEDYNKQLLFREWLESNERANGLTFNSYEAIYKAKQEQWLYREMENKNYPGPTKL